MKADTIKKIILKHSVFLASLLVLALLLAKNPFSQRTLIPNFEPFPDSFHYIQPARCWLRGQGLRLCLLKEGLPGQELFVPPAYSLSLIPGFLLNLDPRMFYFSNLLLSGTALFFLYLIFKKITDSKAITGFALFAYVTTYLTYWLPTLAMAENLLLPTFILSIWLLLEPITKRNFFLAILTGSLMYGSKNAALGLTAVFAFLYLIKIIYNPVKKSYFISSKKSKLQLVEVFLGLNLVLFIMFGGKKILDLLFSMIFANAGFLHNQTSDETVLLDTSQTVKVTQTWTSTKYISQNILFYFNMVIGKPTRVLWDVRPLTSLWLIVIGWFGLIWGAITKQTKWLVFCLVALAIGHVIPALPFYTSDGRYFIGFVPIIFIGVVIFLENIKRHTTKKIPKFFFIILIAILTGAYAIPKLQTWRHQVVLNLKYAEQPWWYLSTLEVNDFFLKQSQNHSQNPKPYLITLINPYFIDFFGNETYDVLPMYRFQDFYKKLDTIWGEDFVGSYDDLYISKLNQGYEVYITNYGITADENLKKRFSSILDNFEGERVAEGCFNQCNIYRLSLPMKEN